MNESPLLSRRLWLGMGLAGLGLGAAAYQWRRQTARQAAALAASAANPAGPRFPEALENLKIHTLSGQPLDLAPWRGQAVFINFWAPWCPPCVKELPLIDRAVGLWKSAAPGRQAMALALDQAPNVKAFLDSLPLQHLSVGLGGLQAMDALRHLGNGAGVLPFSMMIGPDGQVQRSHVGELDDEAIQRWLLGSYTPAASDPA